MTDTEKLALVEATLAAYESAEEVAWLLARHLGLVPNDQQDGEIACEALYVEMHRLRAVVTSVQPT